LKPALDDWLAQGAWFRFAGHGVFYRRGGDDAPAGNRVLLLIHGYPTSTWDWSKIWPRLAARFTVLAPDMLGMGFSDKPGGYRYSVLDHADMHDALVRYLGFDEVHVVAHDIGVSVAQEMLARRYNRERPDLPEIASVTFLNGGLFAEVYRPRPAQRLLSMPGLGDVAGAAMPKPLFKRAMREMFGPCTKPSEDELETFWQVVTYKRGRRVTAKVGRFYRERATYRDRWVAPMAANFVPMRMINGPLDPNSGAHMAQRYREIVPKADVVSLDGIAHWPQFEAPDRVYDALMSFLAD